MPLPPSTAQRKCTDTRHKVASGIAPNFPKNSTKKERAAILLAEDYLSDEAIAGEVGVTKRTITNWKQDPEFAALVGDYHGKIVAQALKLPIAKKHERVTVLNNLHDRALSVIEGRAERYAADVDDAESAINATRRIFGTDTPVEAGTGLLVRQEARNATGQLTVNWAFDRALVSEIRDLHKQAAQELGQWEDRASLDVNHVVREYVGINPEDV